jgi:hypothetical protein
MVGVCVMQGEIRHRNWLATLRQKRADREGWEELSARPTNASLKKDSFHQGPLLRTFGGLKAVPRKRKGGANLLRAVFG